MNEASIQAAADGRDKCDRLLLNADVQWFLAEIAKKHAAADQTLHDLKTDPTERDRAAHVCEALREVSDFIAEQRALYERKIPKPKGT